MTDTTEARDALATARVNVVVVSGVEGPALYIRDYRVAGEKPWGGGTVVCEFEICLADLAAALPDGWTIARRENAEDGAALRELREAGAKFIHIGDGWVSAETYATGGYRTGYAIGHDSTIAAAAREVKDALDLTRYDGDAAGGSQSSRTPLPSGATPSEPQP
jgi:hypothetical protein